MSVFKIGMIILAIGLVIGLVLGIYGRKGKD